MKIEKNNPIATTFEDILGKMVIYHADKTLSGVLYVVNEKEGFFDGRKINLGELKTTLLLHLKSLNFSHPIDYDEKLFNLSITNRELCQALIKQRWKEQK